MVYTILIALICLIPLVVLILTRPNSATLIVVFLIYTNLPVIFKKSFDLPEALIGSFVLILLAPLAFYIVIRREKVIIDQVLALMFVLLAIAVVSAVFYAQDTSIALKWIASYSLEGILLYFLIINVVRSTAVLKQVIWVLLLACSFLGSLSLVQDLTRSYDNTFFGLAQRSIEEVGLEPGSDELAEVLAESSFDRIKIKTTDRAGGPVDGPNRYAQIMIVILPLAILLFLGEGSRTVKILAAISGMLIVSGILLSFSRGAFISLVIMLFVLIFMGTVRPRQAFGVMSVLLLLMAVAAPGYFTRLETISSVKALFVEDPEAVKSSGITRGRTTEMLAAINVFLDHPLLGVGPGQYSKFYSRKYQLDPDIAFRYINKNRRAHTLYAEFAAELGALGLGVFLLIPLVNVRHLRQLRSQGRERHPEITNISTALILGIIAYFSTAIFLHFGFQRYYWLLLGVAGAAIHIFQRKLQDDMAGHNEA